MNLSHPADVDRPIPVLLVDDEPAILESYREILQPPEVSPTRGRFQDMRGRLFGKAPSQRREVFELSVCQDAEGAVRAVREANLDGQPFSIIFLDMRMPPGPDGMWAAARIRELDTRVDIVVVTAYSDIDPDEIAQRVPPTGNLFYLQKPFHTHEIRQLASALGRRRQAEDRIRQLAYYDDITGLPNRAYFKEQLHQSLQQARRTGQKVGLLFIDLDNFKRVNDTLGHSIGDLLLREVAKRLLVNLRASDAVTQGLPGEEGDTLARLGGDEFTILLTGISRAADAGLVARRVIDTLAKPLTLAEHEISVTSSIGIALYPDNGEDVESLLKSADMAMYFAKRAGRNGFQFCTEAMNASALKRITLEQELRQALERGELDLHYQPQIDVKTGRISGVEALLRWNNATLGPVSPAEFIPLAEETGLILPIGAWVLRNACAQAKRWRDAGVRLPRVAVNVSPRQFNQEDFVALVGQALADTGLEPEVLEIEITEGLLMQDRDTVITRLAQLKALGVRLAIDDFGTGYSGLAYLKQFPLDRLKIDHMFVASLNTSPQDQAIATAVIALAERLNLRVTAEGVETQGQLSVLEALRCDEAQGYLLSRPLPAEQVAAFISRFGADGDERAAPGEERGRD